MNRPNSVAFLTSPSTIEPTGCLSANSSHGLLLGLLEAEADAALVAVDLEHHDFDFLAVETILPGWTFFLVQLISETWTRPSMPASSSTNAPYSVMLVTTPDDLRADRVLGGDAVPRIAFELLHAEADALRVRVDADDLHLHGVADVDHFATGG